jgi:hypothetical protein
MARLQLVEGPAQHRRGWTVAQQQGPDYVEREPLRGYCLRAFEDTKLSSHSLSLAMILPRSASADQDVILLPLAWLLFEQL